MKGRQKIDKFFDLVRELKNLGKMRVRVSSKQFKKDLQK